MGRIVFAGAMSHVLDPDYYDRACGAVGRQTVVAVMAEIARMGERLSARQPDALIVVADDHLNAFSFNCVPAMCVRIGRTRAADGPGPRRGVRQGARSHAAPSTRCTRTLANADPRAGTGGRVRSGAVVGSARRPRVPESGEHAARPAAHPAAGADLRERVRRAAADGAAVLRLRPAHRPRRGPQPVERRASSPPAACRTSPSSRCRAWARRTPSSTASSSTGWRPASTSPLQELTADELHKTGSHEFLNWMVLLGAVTPARAAVRYFGELPRINLAAVEWSLP